MELNEKLKEEKAKASLEKELTTLLKQVEMARADAMTEFKASQPFIDSCAVYYGNEFEDCLKQVKSVYPHLDLSKVTMDNPLPMTPASDTIFEETDDSTQSERDLKDDGVVLAQPAMDKLVTLLILSNKAQEAENLPAQDSQDPPPRDDMNPQEALAALVQLPFFLSFFFFNVILLCAFRPMFKQL